MERLMKSSTGQPMEMYSKNLGALDGVLGGYGWGLRGLWMES